MSGDGVTAICWESGAMVRWKCVRWHTWRGGPAEMEIAVSPKHASRESKQQCYVAVSECFKQEKKKNNLTALWSQRAARLSSKTSTEVKATCTNTSCTKWVTTMSLRVHHEECHVAMVGVKLMLSGNARVVITLRIVIRNILPAFAKGGMSLELARFGAPSSYCGSEMTCL